MKSNVGVVAGLLASLVLGWLIVMWCREARRGLTAYRPPQVCEAEADLKREWTRFHANPTH